MRFLQSITELEDRLMRAFPRAYFVAEAATYLGAMALLAWVLVMTPGA